MHIDVAIAGGGPAGAHAAIALRDIGYPGSIALFGSEEDLPFQRSLISKGNAGEGEVEGLVLASPAYWSAYKVALRLSEPIEQVDPARREIVTRHGLVTYGKLIWAAGLQPRHMASATKAASKVRTYLRGTADVGIFGEVPGARRAVVIGGGFSGLETASALAERGIEVTVLEAEQRLAPGSGQAMSTFLLRLHQEHGVKIRLGVVARAITQERGRLGVELMDGEFLPADFIFTAIGGTPNIGPLLEAGAPECIVAGGGVGVDARCKTVLPDVYAIGDSAGFMNRYSHGARVRIASTQHAQAMARCVAANIMGLNSFYEELPCFGSRQFGSKIERLGLPPENGETLMLGDLAVNCFTAIYVSNGVIAAMDTVNWPRDACAPAEFIGWPVEAALSNNHGGSLRRSIHPAA